MGYAVHDNFRMPSRISAVLAAGLITVCASGCVWHGGLPFVNKDTFIMTSESMAPTIKKGERVTATMVDEGYAPKEGQVIVFSTKSWSAGSDRPKFYLSRIIGVPESTVECCDAAGRLRLNGRPLAESYVTALRASSRPFQVHVPAGRIWVMSDNRDVALDSRSHQDAPGRGTISVSDVLGVIPPPA